MTFDSDKLKCLEVIKGHYLDSGALGVVRSMSSDSNKISALKVAVNKSYTRNEIDICKELSFDSYKIDCLKGAGVPYREREGPCSDYRRALQRVKRLIQKARTDIRSGYRHDAVDSLDRALDVIRGDR